VDAVAPELRQGELESVIRGFTHLQLQMTPNHGFDEAGEAPGDLRQVVSFLLKRSSVPEGEDYAGDAEGQQGRGHDLGQESAADPQGLWRFQGRRLGPAHGTAPSDSRPLVGS